MQLPLERMFMLRAVGLFDTMPDAALFNLARALHHQVFSEDTEIVAQGEHGTSMYIIVRGAVRVTRGETELARLGPGDVFGEGALVSSEPRNATVRTTEPCEVLELEQRLFYEAVGHDLNVFRAVIRLLIDRLDTAG